MKMRRRTKQRVGKRAKMKMGRRTRKSRKESKAENGGVEQE